MKLAVMTLFLCAGAAFSPCASAFDEAKLVQQRIDRIEDERATNLRESHELAGGLTVKASLDITESNLDTIHGQIASLEEAIQQLERLSKDLIQSRNEREEKKLYTRADGRDEAMQTIGAEIALIGLSEAAKKYAGAAGVIAFVGEATYRYSRKLENLNQLDELIATNDGNLIQLRDMLSRLNRARGLELQKLVRLRELHRRNLELNGQLAEARAHLAGLRPRPPVAAPARPAVESTPRPPAPRAPPERGIYPMQLVGAWTGSGYNCNGTEPDEFIFISYSPEEGLVATKSLGDECIHSTEVTWTGKLEGKVIHARFHVRGRNAAANTDSWVDGPLEVISVNEIRGFNVRFHRPAVHNTVR